MIIRNLILGVNSITVSYLTYCYNLLQNARDIITKCDSYFITKYGSYRKMRHLLQIATAQYNTLKYYQINTSSYLYYVIDLRYFGSSY